MYYKRKNSSKKLASGSEVLHSLFEKSKSPLADQFKRWKMWAKWDEFVGSTMAQNTEPVGYFNGTLYIWVKNATWLQQFNFMRDEVKNTLNTKLGHNFIKNIRFTLDRKSVPQGATEELTSQIEKLSDKKL